MRPSSTLLLSCISLVAICGLAAPSPMGPSGDVKSAVEHVLRSQQDAWNHHDLDGFMAGYWNSPELTFFSGAKETSGWQATVESPDGTERSPAPLPTRLAAQQWADNRAGGAR